MPKKREPEWIITKGQRSRWQKEQRRKRIAIIAGGAVIAIAVILGALAIWDAAKPEPPTMVGIGIEPSIPSMQLAESLDLKAVKKYDNGKTKPIKSDVVWASSATPTATIDAATGRVTALKEGTATITALWNGQSTTTLLAVMPPTVLEVGSVSFSMDYYVKSLRLTSLLLNYDPSLIADAVFTAIKNNEIHRQLAPALGITVTDAEVESRIIEMSSSPTGGSATPSYADAQERWAEQLKPYEISFEQFREQVQAGLLQEKFLNYVGEQKVPRTAEQVHLRGILFDVTALSSGTPSASPTITPTPTDSGSPAATQDPAMIRQTIKTRLEGGDSFAVLAQEYSRDTASKDTGGDLGWMLREIMTEEYGTDIAEIAFTLEPGTLSAPIALSTAETNTYYWIVEVIEKEDARPLTDEQWNTLAAQAELDWLNEESLKLNIVDHLADISALKAWAAQKASEPFSAT